MKLKRGQKLCKTCNKINGARSHTCKHCDSTFHSATVTKVKKKVTLVDNWKELQCGDIVKVAGRSGNYYVNSMGEKVYMSEHGIYKVMSVDKTGLVVYRSEGGYGYIYMGPEIQSDLIDNMYRSPHTLIKVKNPLKT